MPSYRYQEPGAWERLNCHGGTRHGGPTAFRSCPDTHRTPGQGWGCYVRAERWFFFWLLTPDFFSSGGV